MKRPLSIALWALLALILTHSAARALDIDHEYDETSASPINDTWSTGQVIVVNADAANVVLQVGTVGGGLSEVTTGTLYVLAGDSVNAMLTVNGSSGGHANANRTMTFTDGIGLVGESDGKASLNITGMEKITAGAIELLGNTSLTITNTNLVETDLLTITGTDADEGIDQEAEMVVRNGSNLVVKEAALIGEKGTLAIDGSTAEFTKGMTATGEGSTVELRSGTVTLGDGRMMYFGTGAVLEISSGVSSVSGATGDGVIYNDGGTIRVTSSGSLVAERIVSTTAGDPDSGEYGIDLAGAVIADSLTLEGGGSMRVQSGVSLIVDALAVTNGRADVEGTVLADTTTMAAGSMNLKDSSRLTTDSFDISGGTLQDTAASQIWTDSLTLSGTAVADIQGTLIGLTSIDSLALDLSGSSKLIIRSGAAIGSGGVIDSLAIAGGGELDLHQSLSTDDMNLGGGTVTINGTTGLAYTGTTDLSASSVINFQGDTAGSAVFSVGGGLEFTGGGIFVKNANGAAVNMNGDFVIGSGGSLMAWDKASDVGGTIAVSGVSNFTLGGAYSADYDETAMKVLGAEITGIGAGGSFTVADSSNGKITMSSRLQRLVNSSADIVKILDTDAENGSSNELAWSSSGRKYTYEVRLDPVTGTYGLYVVDSEMLDTDAMRAEIRKNWEKFPGSGSDTRWILKDDMINAIIGGNNLSVGNVNGYDSLSADGKFNADVLATLYDPNTGDSGYDALMLYNGSALGMVSQAVLSSKSRVDRQLGRRNEDLRREMRANDVVDSDSYCPPQLPYNRLWAEGLYHSDNVGRYEGIKGYSYRGKGLSVGYDRMADNLAIGAAFSFINGHYEDASALESNSRAETYSFDLYGTISDPNGLYFAGSAGYAYTDLRLRDQRYLAGNLGWNRSSFGADTYSITGSVGHDFWVGEYMTLTPSLGLAYVTTTLDSHRQSFSSGGLSGNTLVAGKVDDYSFTIPLNLSIGYNLVSSDDALFTISADLGYAYEFNNSGADGHVTYAGLGGIVGPVNIVSRGQGNHLYNLGLRGTYSTDAFDVGFGYDYTGRRKLNAHTFHLRAAMKF